MGQRSSDKKVNGPNKGKGCLKGCLIILAIPIIFFSVLLFFATRELRRSDEDILKTYQPTSEIADIAEKNTLTDKGKATLYRLNPALVDAQDFVKFCRTQIRGVESLACNAPKLRGGPFGGRQIFLLKIDDPKFADHKYAAAVHEMLHSAYNRLSIEEKKNINTLLDSELTKYKTDPYLMTVVDTLKNREGNDTDDVREELHSKFGVEYGSLSPELEEYYTQYFVDRSQVVALFKNGGFDSRVRRMDEINYQIKALTPQMATYQNAGDVANYNRLVGQYNALAAESQRIYSEIKEFYQYFNPTYKSPESKTQ